MKNCLSSRGYDLFESTDSPKSLAEKILKKSLGRNPKLSDLPLNPFKIVKESGAVYHFMDFEDMEGFYLPPENPCSEESLAVISIKESTDVFRQRYTVSHELGHHLLNNEEPQISIQTTGGNTAEEKFVNEFASQLLLPDDILLQLVQKYQLTNIKDDEKYLELILKIAFEVGLSFQATYIRVDCLIKKKLDKKYNRYFKVATKRKELKLTDYFIFYYQIIDSYSFLKWKLSVAIESQFLRLLILNDHRIENGNLTPAEINEVIILRRLGKIDFAGKYNNEEYDLIGEFNMYQRMMESISNIDLSKQFSQYLFITKMHKWLYEYAPYSNVGGSIRETSVYINGKTVKTCEPKKIFEALSTLSDVTMNFENLTSQGQLLIEFAKFHHAFTVIHPFPDGNGRTGRAVLNEQLLYFNFPLFYVEKDENTEYESALEKLDFDDDYHLLFTFITKKILKTYAKMIPQE